MNIVRNIEFELDANELEESARNMIDGKRGVLPETVSAAALTSIAVSLKKICVLLHRLERDKKL